MVFKKLRDEDYVANVWFERDRSNVSLSTPKGRVIFELWDDDVHQAIEDGFLQKPRLAGISCRDRNSNSAWHPHLVAYAREQGLI